MRKCIVQRDPAACRAAQKVTLLQSEMLNQCVQIARSGSGLLRVNSIRARISTPGIGDHPESGGGKCRLLICPDAITARSWMQQNDRLAFTTCIPIVQTRAVNSH